MLPISEQTPLVNDTMELTAVWRNGCLSNPEITIFRTFALFVCHFHYHTPLRPSESCSDLTRQQRHLQAVVRAVQLATAPAAAAVAVPHRRRRRRRPHPLHNHACQHVPHGAQQHDSDICHRVVLVSSIRSMQTAKWWRRLTTHACMHACRAHRASRWGEGTNYAHPY
jgi:hypothetical protein